MIGRQSVFLLCSAVVAAAATGEKLDLYILAGQSNMDGVGGWAQPRHVVPEPRVVVLHRSMLFSGTDKKVRPLPDPLWVALGADRQLGDRGVGPEWGFANALLDRDPNARIGLVKIAASGSNIERWINDPALPRGGADYFSNVVATVRRAQEDGVLRAILWHQGESNSSSRDYDQLFERMVAGYRDAFGTPDLPVIAGTIGTGEKGGVVNEGLARAAARMKNVRVVSSRRTLADNVHYDADSQDELGRCYANALLAMQGRPQPLAITTAELRPGTAGTWYVQEIEATGGDGTMREWSGQGIQITNNFIEGLLPDQPGELPVSVSLKDGSGAAEKKFTLAVAPRTANRIELLPSANFSVSTKNVLRGNRVLFISPAAEHSVSSRAYLRFDVPAEFRAAKSATLVLHVESAGNRPPAELVVSRLKDPDWQATAPAAHPEPGATVAEIVVDKHDSDYRIDLRGVPLADRVGFVIRHTREKDASPVLITSNRGQRPPVLVLER